MESKAEDLGPVTLESDSERQVSQLFQYMRERFKHPLRMENTREESAPESSLR